MTIPSSDPLAPLSSPALGRPTLRPSDHLIVFSRFPIAGQAKTRLIPALGPEGAARLQAALTQHTLKIAETFCAAYPCELEVCFAGGNADSMRHVFGATFRYSEQRGNNLGERLEYAVSAAFVDGAKRVVVIGTDCPQIDTSILSQAFQSLLTLEIVLGPAIDGGYYLIGLRRSRPELFQAIDWGTNRVLRQTLEIARYNRCEVHQLTPLADVDHPEDLVICRSVPTVTVEELDPSDRESAADS